MVDQNALQPSRTMLLMIVQAEDASNAVDALTRAGFSVTRLNAAGGFLRAENAVLVCVVANESTPDVLRELQQHCRRRTQYVFPLLGGDPGVGSYPPVEVEVGGAVVFGLEVEEVAQLAGRARAQTSSA